MKKCAMPVLVVVLFLAAVLFCALWQGALRDRSDLKALAQAGAGEACARFSDYLTTGNEDDYWGGVAAFHTFQTAYYRLSENTPNYTFCNQVYGSLLLAPEHAKAHIADIVDTLELLSQNVMDENGYVRMAELRNTLRG